MIIGDLKLEPSDEEYRVGLSIYVLGPIILGLWIAIFRTYRTIALRHQNWLEDKHAHEEKEESEFQIPKENLPDVSCQPVLIELRQKIKDLEDIEKTGEQATQEKPVIDPQD